MKPPRRVWIIFDKPRGQLDGPHIFLNEKDAKATYKAWKRDAKEEDDGDLLDIEYPAEYVIVKKK